MPTPRKPVHLKAIAGTIQPCRTRAAPTGLQMPPLDVLPPAPEWLPNAFAVREWLRLGAVLIANRLLTEGAVGPLGHLCALHGKLLQLWTAGETPSAATLAQYRNMMNDFGLTPAAAGKVSQAGAAPTPSNAFTNNGKRGPR